MGDKVDTDIPKTHRAVAVLKPREPIAIIDVPTHSPKQSEVLVKVEWGALAPYHVHQTDGGLIIDKYPYILGDAFVGEVVALGPGPHYVSDLRIGDEVLGYSFRNVEDGKEATFQEYLTVPSFLLGRLPKNLSKQSAVTASDNLITVFQAAVTDLGLSLPWPIPQDWAPPEANEPILVWGGAGSVGMYAIQVFRHWGYKRVLAVASRKHHEYLKELGATACFDYRDSKVVSEIRESLGGKGPASVIDCIGHLKGTLQPLTHLADEGAKVAVMLPVIVKDGTEASPPEYQMTSPAELVEGKWKDGVEVLGVRTHFYLENQFFKEKLSPEIVPTLLEQGVIKPNPHREVDGEDLLERMNNGLGMLRRKEVSGEKLVVKVAQ